MNKITNFLRVALVLISFTFAISTTFAQVPQALNYQAVARNASGALIANHAVSLRLTVLQGSSTGTAIYAETQTVTTNQFGLFTLAIGTGTVVSGTFSSIPWSTGLFWLKTELDPTGGTSYIPMGTSQLLSVPFAMYAQTSTSGVTGPTGPQGPAGSGNVSGTTNYVAKFTSTSGVGNSLLFDNGSAIGLGTTTPSTSSLLDVNAHSMYGGYFTSDFAAPGTNIIHAEYNGVATSSDVTAVYGLSKPQDWSGIGGEFEGGYEGIYAHVNSAGSHSYYGVNAGASGGSGNNYALSGNATGSGTNYGLYATATGGTVNNAGYFDAGNVIVNTGKVGIGTTTPNSSTLLDVSANSLYAGYFTSDDASPSTNIIHAEYTGTAADAVAVYGKASGNDFYGFGGEFIGGYTGAYAHVTPTGSSSYFGLKAEAIGGTGNNYGLSATASNNAGIANYGIWTTASGATRNYAGFFNAGDVIVYSGKLAVGTATPSGHASVHVNSHNQYAGYFVTDSVGTLTEAIHAECTTTAANDNIAVYGKSNSADGYGYGGWFEGKRCGVLGKAAGNSVWSNEGFDGYATNNGSGGAYGVGGDANSNTGTAYGVYGNASTTSGTAYGVYCSGNGAYTGTWTLASDKKFKKDVTDLQSDALDNLLKLRPVSYTMKIDEFPEMNFAKGKQMGFIAQEMQEVFPSLVEKGVHPGAKKEDAYIEYLGVNYIGLIPVLVKAIQEHEAKITLQETKMADQNAKIIELEKKIIELESK